MGPKSSWVLVTSVLSVTNSTSTHRTTELGNLVIIYHGNEFFTYYGHNELILVKPYEKVKRGDVISTSGNSGISSGPHLHFEIWKDGEPVDPLLYFPELNKSNISVK